MAAKRRLQAEHDHDLTIAWVTAKLSRAKDIPPLKQILKGTTKQTPQEQAEMWRHIGNLVGRVRKHDKRRVRIIRG